MDQASGPYKTIDEVSQRLHEVATRLEQLNWQTTGAIVQAGQQGATEELHEEQRVRQVELASLQAEARALLTVIAILQAHADGRPWP